jgi:hypothetical protein
VCGVRPFGASADFDWVGELAVQTGTLSAMYPRAAMTNRFGPAQYSFPPWIGIL